MARLKAHYRVCCAEKDIEAFAQSIALEQSVEVPMEVVRDAYVKEHIVGNVESILSTDAAAAAQRSDGKREFLVKVALATETTGNDVAQTFNMLFGNTSMHDTVELVDVEFPDGFAQQFGGPRFGLEGLRDLTGANGRPLTCAALKPQGLSVVALADICRTFALNGVDVIKDDHGLANQFYSPFRERVSACQAAIESAFRETGRRVLYAPSLVGSPSTLFEQARFLREEGVGAALLAPSLLGLPLFHEMVKDHLAVPILAHPSFSGAARIAQPLLMGRLFRMLGADAVVYPHYAGRFAYPEATCSAIARECLAPWKGIRTAVPVPAGGMTVERVPELMQFYGSDVMLLIGGSLLRAGDALPARTREFVIGVASGYERAAKASR
jgi:ribulose-bisphosphate carboxylase large chain